MISNFSEAGYLIPRRPPQSLTAIAAPIRDHAFLSRRNSRTCSALDEPKLSPRELATRFTDTKNYFVSEASVYRLLKEHDLIASPAYIVMKAADEFKDKTTAPNQLWQTDFTYLKVIGWAEPAKDPAMRSIVGWQAEGWFYLSTILDDFSRYIIAWLITPRSCSIQSFISSGTSRSSRRHGMATPGSFCRASSPCRRSRRSSRQRLRGWGGNEL
jgi:hypothetical protein